MVELQLKKYQQACVDVFRMEFSEKDIRGNKEAEKLANFINRQGRKIDRIVRLIAKLRNAN